MEELLQRMPYDALGKRRILLDTDKVVIAFKSLMRSYSDEYPYSGLNPDFKNVRRGEAEWSGMIYGIVIFSLALFLIGKLSHSLLFKSVMIGIQLCAIVAAAYLFTLIYFKREYAHVLDASGECIFSVKITPKSKKFLAALREKITQSKPRL